MKKTITGFTIVELLIVIVVIAILATISIVAYNGIRDRANDSAVQSDLTNTVKKIQLIHAGTGAYPVGGAQIAVEGGSSAGISNEPTPGFEVSVNRAAYLASTGTGAANYVYCTGTGVVSGQAEYVMSVHSKSWKVFQYSSMRGFESLGVTPFSYATLLCNGIGYPRSVSYGYFSNSGGWQSWTN